MKILNILTLAFIVLGAIFYGIQIFFLFHPAHFTLYNKSENSWKEISIHFPNFRMGGCTKLGIDIENLNLNDPIKEKIYEEIIKNLIITEEKNGQIQMIKNIYNYYDISFLVDIPSECSGSGSNIHISFHGNIDTSIIPGDIILNEMVITK